MTDKMVARAVGTGPASWSLGGLFETLVAGGETGGLVGAARGTQPPGARAIHLGLLGRYL